MVFNKSKRSKRKAYFISANPSKKRRIYFNLSPGMKGFICTCNGNMTGCIREALNILDDYESKLNLKDSQCEVENLEDVDDIEKTLKQEICSAKNPEKKFRPVDTGANNCIFISSQVNNVLEIADAIMKDVDETKVAKSRFLIRLVPIEVTCKAYNDDIKKAADGIFDAHFKGEPTSYCIHINKRSNNNLLKQEVTEDLVRLVRDRSIKHVVDLKNPAKTVIVEIIRNICCLSVVNNFFKLRKYNLIELASSKNIELQTKEEPHSSVPDAGKMSEGENPPAGISNTQESIKAAEPDANETQRPSTFDDEIPLTTPTDKNSEITSDIPVTNDVNA